LAHHQALRGVDRGHGAAGGVFRLLGEGGRGYCRYGDGEKSGGAIQWAVLLKRL
jgi:hypothetical protein